MYSTDVITFLRRYSNSSEKCPLLPSPVAAQQSLSIIDGKISPKRLEFKETEEEVQEEKVNPIPMSRSL